MSSKNTWLWLTVAAALFAFIFLFEHYRPQPEIGPAYLLPGLEAKAIKSVQIRTGQTDIGVERTNGGWQLVEPVVYPAQNTNVQKLLEALQQLTVVHRIDEKEFRKDPKAGEDYGVEPSQLSLILDSGPPIFFGHRTSPGDQVFVRIPGKEGVAIVDAEVLNLFPQDANGWRDTRLANFKTGTFDRIAVTNTMKSQWSFVLQRDPTNKLWTMPSLTERADSEKVEDALGKLEKLRVRQFVSDDPKADLEPFGLQPPVLTLALGQGTNTLLALDLGKELTNSPGLIYARRRDQPAAVVAISTNTLGQWNTSFDVFRDRHLVTLLGPIESIHVAGHDEFTLQWQTNNTWHLVPPDFPIDERMASHLARALSELQVANFEKDSVVEIAWPVYGLTAPIRKYTLTWAATTTVTNPPTELDFGTNGNNQIFARRLGEDAVYGIARADFEALPSASWQLRDRHIWNFDINDVSQIIVQQNGQTQQLVRNGTNGWKIAAGSTGQVNDSALEDTTGGLGHLTAFAWAGHGVAKLAEFGITPGGHQITIQMKNGEQLAVQLGNATALDSVYASVMLHGEPWIFEFPPDLYPSVKFCLTIPPAP